MILDSSAVVAIVFGEPGFERLERAIDAAPIVGIGAPTAVETTVVLAARMGPAATGVLDRFLATARAMVVPFQGSHHREAVTAYLRFGRGRHPARLNLGDCFSYATARVAGLPLLCAGHDSQETGFPKTDLPLVDPGP